MSVSKEDIAAIVECVVVANMRIAGQMMNSIDLKALTAGMQTGLVFSVEAGEVRDMLRAKAALLRTQVGDIEASAARAGVAIGNGLIEHEVARLRALADNFDWQARHLVERSYTLSLHEIEFLAPSQSPNLGCYAQYPGTRVVGDPGPSS